MMGISWRKVLLKLVERDDLIEVIRAITDINIKIEISVKEGEKIIPYFTKNGV